MQTSGNARTHARRIKPMSDKQGGPLTGIKIVEIGGIGPSPLCCALLSDMGADIIRVDRPEPSGLGLEYASVKADVRRRGRPSIAVDLKHPQGIETVLRLVAKADAIIDPFRPGVMERLGLGPDDCMKRNPRLIYGRITGWGQNGPIADSAGHDINYIALSGVLHAIGTKAQPVPPLNVVGDMGGGAMFLALGLLAGIIEAKSSGRGQVVDAAMSEGAAYLALGCFGLTAVDQWNEERENNILDGGAPFYRVYETQDGKFVSIGSIEPKFYALLIEKMGLKGEKLPAQNDRSQWPAMRERFAAVFRTKTRDEWCAIMEGSDVCFAPVLNFREAAAHPQALARGSFVDLDGVIQPAPAPRFSRTPSSVKSGPAPLGSQTNAALAAWGFAEADIADLTAQKAIGLAQ
jgi:alpha-methylacyl-CoA racemase